MIALLLLFKLLERLVKLINRRIILLHRLKDKLNRFGQLRDQYLRCESFLKVIINKQFYS